MELIWLKLKSELNRLQDTVQRDQRELKISERREMHGEERGAAWKRELGWECIKHIAYVKGEVCRNCVIVHVIFP